MNEIQLFTNDKLDLKVRTIQNQDGSILVNAEDTARGFGWIQVETKGDKIYSTIKWARMNKFIKELGSSECIAKGDYIPLELVFKLEYKSRYIKRHEFIKLICNSLKIKRPIIEQEMRFEKSFYKQLVDTLEPLGYEVECQKNIFNCKYRIDFYIKELNIAIEYDESHHFVEPQKSKDIKRQKAIEKELGCQFVRLDYRNTDAYNVGLVLNKVFNVKSNT